jgi:Fur family iron response transcriptional regulator
MQNIQSNNDIRMNRICIMGMLRHKDIKLTKQRVALASLLFNLPTGHVTAEELHDETKKKELRISLATVYNTLNHFSENGLIKTLQVDNQKTFFDRNTEHHYHFKYKEVLEDIKVNDMQIKYNSKNIPQGKKIKSIDIVINLIDE